MTLSAYARGIISRRDKHRASLPEIADSIPQYSPVNDKAAEFHSRQEKIRLLFGGNGSGKTYTGGADSNQFSRTHPGSIAWSLTNTYKGIGQYLWPTYQKTLAPHEYKVVWADRLRNIPYKIIYLPGMAERYFLSYEQGRENLQGSRIDQAHLDEEAPEPIWREVFARTLGREGRIICTMTPLKGKTYIYGVKKKHGDGTVWAATMSLLDNPYVSESEKQAFLDMLSKKGAESRIYGNFVSMEGLVYEDFREDVHVIDPFPIPDTWQLYRGIDFGWEHPTTSIICAYDGYTLYVVSEYYQNRRLIEYHAEQMHKQKAAIAFQSGSNSLASIITISDHDRQEREQYERQGIYSEPADKKVLDGIEQVRNILKIHSDGHTRLKVFRTCEHTIEEFQLYHLPGEDTKGHIKPEEKADNPVKENDHCLDPLRYIVVKILGYFNWSPHDIEAE